MKLQHDIESWNGKSADDIAAVYYRHSHQADFPTKTISLIKLPSAQKGATWLLKKYLETKVQLSARQINQIYNLLAQLEHWEAKLHVLQCIPYMPISKAVKTKLKAFLNQCLVDDNKFVRAWAYNGFYELSVQHREYQSETERFFDMAMKDEAASVKARIRQLMKKGF